jgi:hypothetical protein
MSEGHAETPKMTSSLPDCGCFGRMSTHLSGISPCKDVLRFLEELVDSKIPCLRICVISRPETDIKVVLKRLAPYTNSLHDERRQIDDINGSIMWFVNNDEWVQGWTKEVKQHVIDILTRKADGM